MAKHADDSSRLLAQLAQMGSGGRAEGEGTDQFPKTFHPVAEHAPHLRSKRRVGDRSSQQRKSELFRAAVELNLLPAIQRCLPHIRLPLADSKQITWLAGYPVGIDFPDPRGFADSYVATKMIVMQRLTFGSHIWSVYSRRN